MYKPKYTLTNALLITIGKIEAAKEVIMNAPLLPMWEKKFRDSALARSIHHGTHIEGNQLDFEEAKQVIFSQNMHVARSRDVQEILNYRAVLDYIESEWQDSNASLGEKVITKIHALVVNKILPQELAGTYRTKKVVIKDSSTGDITFTPPEPEDVPLLISEFASWFSKIDARTLHPVLKAGISHHELVRIHPFLDGNGRVARAVSTLVLYVGGYDIRRFFSLEEQYDKDPLSYYEYLQKANQGDLTPWLEYFTDKLALELEIIKQKIKRLSIDSHMKERLGGKQLFLNERQMKMLEYIQDAGYLQNQAFGSLFPDYSEDTVLRDLKELMDKNVIKKVGKTKGAKYVSVKT